MKTRLAIALAFFAFAAVLSVRADGTFHCEVLAVDGDVRVMTPAGSSTIAKEGDLLSEGDSIEVPDGGSVDLAYDKEWSNIARLEGGTKAKLGTIVPAKLDVSEGAVYAKLKNLPTTTSFEVKTPTAVAAVRGTEYRTVVVDGETEVFNFSPSKVFVYGMDASGVQMTEPAVLEQDQKTAIESKGEAPKPPAPMAVEDKKKGETAQKAIKAVVERAVTSGRVGKTQAVSEIENSMRPSGTRYDEESKVSDSRRRSFR